MKIETKIEWYVNNYIVPKTPLRIVKGEEFCMEKYRDETPIVTFTLEPDSDVENKIFYKFLSSNGLNKSYDELFSLELIFALSLLHEIAHVITLDNFSKTDRIMSSTIIQSLEILFERYETSNRVTNDLLAKMSFDYWNVPTEKAAQDFVVKFANEHPLVVYDLMNFYKEGKENYES